MTPRPMLVLVAATAVSLLLAGCTSVPVSVASNTYPSVPQGYTDSVNLISAEPMAVWVHGKTLLAVITVGSKACPPVPTSITASDATTVDVTFVKSPNSPCEANISPTTHEFKIPEGVDPESAVTVTIHLPGGQEYPVEVLN